ncbi:MAG: DUF3768 domain-containing protein [Oligoflexales bacterium]
MSKEQIRAANDRLRTSFLGGKVMLTPLVRASGYIDQIIRAVREFNDFNPHNDPHEEHDLGIVSVSGEEYMFKIDHYDDNYEMYQACGSLVMLIMHRSEY